MRALVVVPVVAVCWRAWLRIRRASREIARSVTAGALLSALLLLISSVASGTAVAAVAAEPAVESAEAEDRVEHSVADAESLPAEAVSPQVGSAEPTAPEAVLVEAGQAEAVPESSAVDQPAADSALQSAPPTSAPGVPAPGVPAPEVPARAEVEIVVSPIQLVADDVLECTVVFSPQLDVPERIQIQLPAADQDAVPTWASQAWPARRLVIASLPIGNDDPARSADLPRYQMLADRGPQAPAPADDPVPELVAPTTEQLAARASALARTSNDVAEPSVQQSSVQQSMREPIRAPVEADPITKARITALTPDLSESLSGPAEVLVLDGAAPALVAILSGQLGHGSTLTAGGQAVRLLTSDGRFALIDGIQAQRGQVVQIEQHGQP